MLAVTPNWCQQRIVWLAGSWCAENSTFVVMVIWPDMGHTYCSYPSPPTLYFFPDNAGSLAEALKAIMLARKDQENFQLIVITHDEAFAHQIGTRDHAEYLWRITKVCEFCTP